MNLLGGRNSLNEVLDARVLIEDGRVRFVVVVASARQQAAVEREGARRAAVPARAARPVHAAAAPLARHVREPVHQQRRRAAPRHRVPNLRCLLACHIVYHKHISNNTNDVEMK